MWDNVCICTQCIVIGAHVHSTAGVSDPAALVHTRLVLFLMAGIRESFMHLVGFELGFEG